ncbi:hypothetical protein NQ315_008129 [Exocentrus adspersus]|uniref:Uncharacterized protein n=1 Tax=Exocentrus adspersus TaxID=1586481 RepID=A0AAV8VWJ2_9CUCU|nr:hypothetical protein NQ315_008129 [Exocentrus adspersus]
MQLVVPCRGWSSARSYCSKRQVIVRLLECVKFTVLLAPPLEKRVAISDLCQHCQLLIHKTLGKVLSFIVGLYAGIYISQNYDIPRVDDPSALYEKIKDFANKHRKD